MNLGPAPPGVPELVQRLAQALQQRGQMMASAESCTGGLIAAACTELAGSSLWFERGVVSYGNGAKTALLGVPAALIERHGAVSEPVALAMARGVLNHAPPEVAFSVAVTGVAGPGGGSPAKPVGTVWLAWAWRRPGQSPQARAARRHFPGTRSEVRAATVQAALAGLLGLLPTDAALDAAP